MNEPIIAMKQEHLILLKKMCTKLIEQRNILEREY